MIWWYAYERRIPTVLAIYKTVHTLVHTYKSCTSVIQV